MFASMRSALLAELERMRAEHLFKQETAITSPQDARIRIENGRTHKIINLCANNYLGLANHPKLIQAAQKALQEYGFGMASVRFICGTLDIHRQCEQRLSAFLGTDDTILHSSCFDANTGLFEALLDDRDAVISDALNHASIIDGIRLCKARRLRYGNNNMQELEARLREAADCRYRVIATDGVFSMDGVIANLSAICDLAERYDALVMVDDSHAVGLMGPNGSGTPAHFGVTDKVDIVTGTLGKALGGASGGYVSGRREIVEWLRQKSRPYLFSNTLAPVITATSLVAIDLVENDEGLRDRLWRNTDYFRSGLEKRGFAVGAHRHPIVPVMLGDARIASEMARDLLALDVFVTSFSYPVVPQGQARIRAQISAAHSEDDLAQALAAFEQVARKLGVI